MGDHLRRRGIAIQTTAPYAHQQNGKAERYIRTLVDGDMRTRGLVLYCAGASSRGLFIRHNIAERERER